MLLLDPIVSLPWFFDINDGVVSRLMKGKGRIFEHLKRSGMDHTAFTLQIHHTPLLPRKHSPDGTTIASGNNHLITAYYSFIEPQKDESLELT